MYRKPVTVRKRKEKRKERNLPHKPVSSKTTDNVAEEVSLLPLAEVQSEITKEV